MRMKFRMLLLALLLMTFQMVAVAQSEHVQRTLVVNGKSGVIDVFRIDGKSYVDLQTLVRISNATVTLQGDKIVLTFPASQTAALTPTASQQTPQTPAPDNASMSSAFMRDGVQFLTTIKDWTGTLTYGIQRGIPGDGSRMVKFHDRSAEALRLVQVEANTEPEKNAYQLLAKLFGMVSGWNDELVSQRRNMNTGQYSMDPNALQNDPTYQTISACGKFLGAMIPSGQFQDDGSCH